MKRYLALVIAVVIAAPAAAQGPRAGIQSSSWKMTAPSKVEPPVFRLESAKGGNWKKGAVIGGGIGLFLGVLGRNAPNYSCTSGRTACQVKLVVAVGAVGAVIGGVLGALHTWKPKEPAPTTGATFRSSN